MKSVMQIYFGEDRNSIYVPADITGNFLRVIEKRDGRFTYTGDADKIPKKSRTVAVLEEKVNGILDAIDNDIMRCGLTEEKYKVLLRKEDELARKLMSYFPKDSGNN